MALHAFDALRRAGLIVAASSLAFAGVCPPVEAAPKKTDKTAKKEEAGKPTLVANFNDWNVFVGQAGKGRICYTLAQPKSREPASLKRDPGYAFISDRPAEGVRNEVSFIMGFDISGGTDADAQSASKPDAKPAARPPSRTQGRRSRFQPRLRSSIRRRSTSFPKAAISGSRTRLARARSSPR